MGGLHFRLNRSAYYVREFKILLKTLQVTQHPDLDLLRAIRAPRARAGVRLHVAVGQRLRAVRERLLTVTEMIETSALVGQSAATRHNTAVLRQTTTLAIVLLTLYVARTFIGNVLGSRG